MAGPRSVGQDCEAEKGARRVDIRLIRFKEDGESRDFRVTNDRCLIGRQATCDLPIPLSSVSREHCEIFARDGAVYMKDLGSRNGTFRNEERVEGEVQLEPGDRVAIGPIIFTVQIDGDPAEVEPPLMEAPTLTTAKPQSSSGSASAKGGGDDSASELSDLIKQMQSEDSSVFDLDMYLDEDDDES